MEETWTKVLQDCRMYCDIFFPSVVRYGYFWNDNSLSNLVSTIRMYRSVSLHRDDERRQNILDMNNKTYQTILTKRNLINVSSYVVD